MTQKLAFDLGTALLGPNHFLTSTTGVGTLASIIVSNAVVIAAIILFFLFLVGGFTFISGSGQNDPQKAAQGKNAITAAVAGFVIIFVAYWIIRLIERLFGFSILG